MNAKTICQSIIWFSLAGSMVVMIYRDINGREAKAPTGFGGVMASITATIVMAIIYYFAFKL